MALPAWHEEPIAKRHDRARFDCGNTELNQYLANHARQHHENGTARTFVVVRNDDPTQVMGYYSLVNSEVRLVDLPEPLRAKIPAYPAVGAHLLARLAVDREFQGQGLGAQLLLLAGERALEARRHSGSLLLVIDAKEDAVEFYTRNDAVPLNDQPRRLVITLASIERAIAEVKARR